MATKTKEEIQNEAQEKVKYEGFFGKNTEEVKFPDGSVHRVNKFEAKKLKEKLAKAKK